MTRNTLEDNNIYRPNFWTGIRTKTSRLVITANFTIPAGAPGVMNFDATNTNRTITLPAAVDGLTQQIGNISTGTAQFTIQDPTGPTTIATLPPGTTGWFMCFGTTWTFIGLDGAGNAMSVLPFQQYSTISQASGVIPAANFAGSANVVLSQSGATALTTPTAAAILAAMSGAAVGVSYRLRLINTNGGTLTITADASVTLTGTATLATQTWREWIVTMLTATTASMQQVGTGTNS